MELLTEHKMEFAVLLVRMVAGILFLSQGYDKIFRIGLRRAGDASAEVLRPLGIPSPIVRLLTIVTAIAEFTCGLMLITGFLIVPAAYILGACMLPIIIAMSWKEPMWNLQHVWARLVLVTFLLLVPVRAHTIALDYIFGTYAG